MNSDSRNSDDSQSASLDVNLFTMTEFNIRKDSGFKDQEVGCQSSAGAGVHYLGRDIRPGSSSSYSPDSPRKRRTGLMTVMEKPPDITDEVISDVENRIQQQHLRSISPVAGGPPGYLPYPQFDSPNSLSPLSPVSAITSPSHGLSSLQTNRHGCIFLKIREPG